MKKIMFNDRYGLTKTVLDRKKTMTRRIVKLCEKDLKFLKVSPQGEYLFCSANCLDGAYPYYKFGEEVAVAQPYKDAIHSLDWVNRELYQDTPGWNNKMFVMADLMPHRIRITDIKVERLQDISDEDCMKEGIEEYTALVGSFWSGMIYKAFTVDGNEGMVRKTPREAFAALIDRISGNGTWERNPYVFAYKFELVCE